MAKKKQTNPRIAVVTTFPNEHYSICAEEMLTSFAAYWPQEIKIYIQLDEQPKDQFDDLNNKIVTVMGEDRSYIAGKFDEDQKNFIKLFSAHKPKSYLDDVVKFSHKVFALEKCADAIKDEVDYIIWLDADVITKKPIDYEWLKTLLPGDDEVVSYLHRKGLHSECGWVAYNMKSGGYELLKQMKGVYIGANFDAYPKGVTDCHILDQCLEDKKFKDLCPDYVYGVDDINVWPKSKLAERTAHRKGNRKHEAASNRNKPAGGNVIDANNMNIKTRNCLDHDKIKSNVHANLSQIRAWATLCRPIEGAEIVMCSAGPSLVNHIDEIKSLQAKGAQVVCVKHAIDTLKLHGIKPWAVVLLDPRSHVEEFIKNPDPDVVYFVASMCDPAVVKTLNDNKCKVIGYHAFVNAGEMELMLPADLPVSGGSGTATRSIGLFSDMFGFKTFHLFGYDLSWQHKPNFEEKTIDGQPKYMELNIGTQTHKNKTVTRTFWTEGQLLAQSNELKSLYKDRKDLKIEIYGDGLAGWMFRHWKLHESYKVSYNQNLEAKRVGNPTVQEFINAISRGSELARNA